MERGQKVIYADDIALGANMTEELQQAVAMWDNQLAIHGRGVHRIGLDVYNTTIG
jgi:hypothetical protein